MIHSSSSSRKGIWEDWGSSVCKTVCGWAVMYPNESLCCPRDLGRTVPTPRWAIVVRSCCVIIIQRDACFVSRNWNKLRRHSRNRGTLCFCCVVDCVVSAIPNGAERISRERSQNNEQGMKENSSPSEVEDRDIDVEIKTTSVMEETRTGADVEVIGTLVVLFDYKPEREDELELKKGEYIDLHERRSGGWWLGKMKKTGKVGCFPYNYVRFENGDIPTKMKELGTKAAVLLNENESGNKDKFENTNWNRMAKVDYAY